MDHLLFSKFNQPNVIYMKTIAITCRYTDSNYTQCRVRLYDCETLKLIATAETQGPPAPWLNKYAQEHPDLRLVSFDFAEVTTFPSQP